MLFVAHSYPFVNLGLLRIRIASIRVLVSLWCMRTLGEMGEHEVIRRLTAGLGTASNLVVGSGDDCAVVRLPGGRIDQVFTTDPVIEGVHFKQGENPLRVGNKAAGRVLSDIAAMGAVPRWLLVNVVAPANLEFSFLEKTYEGMSTLCRRFGTTIIGGDVAEGSGFELHVFGVGELPAGSALLRSDARIGDIIFVTGALGDSISGRHLDFVPRVEEGIFLRESGLVNSMMDISDGLATDLRHILKQSNVGAVLDEDDIPRNSTLEKALYDGEDFELLGSISPENIDPLQSCWEKRFDLKLSIIGTVASESGMLQLRSGKNIYTLKDKAFEHFST